MRILKTIIEFKCDRCGEQKERNICEDSGTLIDISATICTDMKYGNKTNKEYNFCQKCSNEFQDFIKLKDISIDTLNYFYNTSVGLWVTDKEDIIPSELKDKYFWELGI